MLAYWRQHSSTLAYKWGVLEYEAEETERPQFTGMILFFMMISIFDHVIIIVILILRACIIGRKVYDEENDEWTKEYSTWRRFVLKYALSTPVLVCFILAVLSATLSFFRSHDDMIASYNAGEDIKYFSSSSESTENANHDTQDASLEHKRDISIHLTLASLSRSDFWAVLLLYPTLYGILIGLLFNTYACMHTLNCSLLDSLYIMPCVNECMFGRAVVSAQLFYAVAESLNDFENHRTNTDYINRLILKVGSYKHT